MIRADCQKVLPWVISYLSQAIHNCAHLPDIVSRSEIEDYVLISDPKLRTLLPRPQLRLCISHGMKRCGYRPYTSGRPTTAYELMPEYRTAAAIPFRGTEDDVHTLPLNLAEEVVRYEP